MLLTQKSVTRVNLQLLRRESGQVVKSGASESHGEEERNHKSLTYSAACCYTTRASSVKRGPEVYKWKGNKAEDEHFLTRVDSWEGGEEPQQQLPLGGSEHDRASAALNS